MRKLEAGQQRDQCQDGSRLNEQFEGWCPGTESNRHAPFGARDFKSRASASFATRAGREVVEVNISVSEEAIFDGLSQAGKHPPCTVAAQDNGTITGFATDM